MRLTTTRQQAWFFYFTAILCIAITLAYLIPETVAYIVASPKSFQNAWDKVNYLSYQGVLGVKNVFGYYTLHFIYLLHQLNIPPVFASLMFDIVMPSSTILLIYLSLRKYHIPNAESLGYAFIILFASVLVNYSNPLIPELFGPMADWHRIAVGLETYPSVLRFPNPQFSYFLISLCIYLRLQFNKNWLLLLPLPLLYYFVAVPYVYLLFVGFFILKQSLCLRHIIVLNVITYIAVAVGVYLAFTILMRNNSTITTDPLLYRHTRELFFPLVTLILFSLYGILKLGKFFKTATPFYENTFISLIFCSFAISNFQLINHFILALKNYQDYANSIIIGLCLVLTLEIIRTQQPVWLNQTLQRIIHTTLLLGLLIYMLRIILLSQGFNFHTYQYQLQLGPQLTHEQIKKIQDDPLHAIILDDRLSQSIVYSTPQMIAPVFAFQYNYGFILKQCEGLIELSQNAFDFIKSRYGINSAEYRAIKPRADLFFQAVLKHKDMSFRHLPYCNLLYQPKSFFVIYPNFEQTVYTFPAINLKRVIKHLFHRLHHHKQ